MRKIQNTVISAAIVCLLSSSAYSTDYQENNFYTPRCNSLKTMFVGFGLLLMPNLAESPHPPTPHPTNAPTFIPTNFPTLEPTTGSPTLSPTLSPTHVPTHIPTGVPTLEPTLEPTSAPTSAPTLAPTICYILCPTTSSPTHSPTTVSRETNAIKEIEEIVRKNWMIPQELEEEIPELK